MEKLHEDNIVSHLAVCDLDAGKLKELLSWAKASRLWITHCFFKPFVLITHTRYLSESKFFQFFSLYTLRAWDIKTILTASLQPPPPLQSWGLNKRQHHPFIFIIFLAFLWSVISPTWYCTLQVSLMQTFLYYAGNHPHPSPLKQILPHSKLSS